MSTLELKFQAANTLYVDAITVAYFFFVLTNTACTLSLLKVLAWIGLPFLMKVCVLISVYQLNDINAESKYYAFVLRCTLLTFVWGLYTLSCAICSLVLSYLLSDTLWQRQLSVAFILSGYILAVVIALRRWGEMHHM